VSPNWPFEVTREQRVEAYKYLGACLTLAGKRDSAVLFFRAAIERDPFTELDPNLFTPAQLATFGEAQRRTFAVAVRPVASAREDTLPALDRGALLPERISPEAARRDVAKGLGVAGAALVIAGAANGDLGGGERGGAVVVAATAAVTGVVAFLVGRGHGAIPQNIVANARRRAERDSANASVRGRNAGRIAATVLLVSPAAGEGPGP